MPSPGAPPRSVAVALALALLFLAGSSGWALARADGDEVPGSGSVDVGFLLDMTVHHEQALTMANDQVFNGRESIVRSFAREILRQQSYEIGLMTHQLRDWGQERRRPERAMAWMGAPVAPGAMPGMASEAELDLLGAARGHEADALFLALMTEHHEGGVVMAEVAAREAESPWVRELAVRMARNQALEIREMALARERIGLPADPPGYRRDDVRAAHTHGG